MEKRALINFVLQNATIEGEILRYKEKFPFYMVLKYAPSSAWLPRWDVTRTKKWVSEWLFEPNAVALQPSFAQRYSVFKKMLKIQRPMASHKY